MKQLKLSGLILLSCGILGLTACSEEVVVAEIQPLTVRTTYPRIEDFSTRGITVASLEPSSRVALIPGVAGEVEEVFVTLGETVNQGDLICIVDSENVETQISNANDGVTRAQESIAALTEGMLVKAPVSGYVQSIDEKLSHAVSASSQLAYLSNQKQMTVKLPFLDSAVSSGWIGATASLSFVDTGEAITGRVTEISGAPDFLYGNIAVNYVTITVDNPGGIPTGRRVAGQVNGVTCSADGEFASEASSPVISGLSGTVDAIYVSVGQYVTAGTPMFRIVNPSTENQLQSAQNALSDAVESRTDAFDLLGDYRVTANISGTISNVLVSALDMISGSSAVVEISTTDHMKLSFSVSESVLPYLELGQELNVSSQGKSVVGHISEINSVASQQTGLFTVVGEIRGEDVLSGTSAHVEFTDFTVEDALVIPFEAVQFIGEESFVFVVEEGLAVKKPVTLSHFSETDAIITEGLSSNEQLISTWNTQLRNGLAVKEEE